MVERFTLTKVVMNFMIYITLMMLQWKSSYSKKVSAYTTQLVRFIMSQENIFNHNSCVRFGREIVLSAKDCVALLTRPYQSGDKVKSN